MVEMARRVCLAGVAAEERRAALTEGVDSIVVVPMDAVGVRRLACGFVACESRTKEI